MNQHEALKFLGVHSISESEEAIENKLFEIKQEITANCHVPQLIVAKQKKLKQISSISEIFNIQIPKEESNFQLEKLETDSMLDSFNLYHKNRSQILQKIFSSNDIHFIIYCSDLLLLNLKIWAEKWPKLDTHSKEEVKLSKELESVEMYRLIKEMNEKGIVFFNELEKTNISESLKIEIGRLNNVFNLIH
jgi:hypothetical protein